MYRQKIIGKYQPLIDYECKVCGFKSKYISDITCSQCLRDTTKLNIDVHPMNGPIEVHEVDMHTWNLCNRLRKVDK